METKYWKTEKMNVEIVRRTESGIYQIIRLLEPLYKTKRKNIVAYDVGTEIVVADKELL